MALLPFIAAGSAAQRRDGALGMAFVVISTLLVGLGTSPAAFAGAANAAAKLG